MSGRDSDRAATDGGMSFTRVDWDDIDPNERARSRTELAWMGVVGVWLLAVVVELYSQYVAGTGRYEFPLVGTVATVDWLWSMTILTVAYYGVLPLIQRPRMARYYWKEFKKNKAAVISALYLVVVFLVGTIGTRFVDAPEPTPGLENQPPVFLSVQRYVVGTKCPGGVVEGGEVPRCTGSWEYPLGTDTSGEDILHGLIHGMEISMQVGMIATLISTAIAATVGLTAAYYGGLIDEVLMRYVDIQITFPTFFLFLLLAYTFGGSLFLLIMIFGLFGWGSNARIMRSEALQRREEPYMTASKAAGASSLWAMRRHLLPNISNSLITIATLSVPGIILAEAAFAFLGLADPTLPSWGRYISDGRNRLTDAWWISTIPGVFLFFTILAFNFVGDALRDALDPRHGGSGE